MATLNHCSYRLAIALLTLACTVLLALAPATPTLAATTSATIAPAAPDAAPGSAANTTNATRDLGDAPDSTNHAGVAMSAYTGIPANYPTVFDPAAGVRSGRAHLKPRPFHLGQQVSREAEADMGPDEDPTNNIQPAANTSNLDRFDDGTNFALWNLAHCQKAQLPVQVFIDPQAVNWFMANNTKGYLNIWLDSNRDGDWADGFTCVDSQGVARTPVEHIVIDYPVDVVALGAGLHIVQPLTGPVFWPAAAAGKARWVRMTLSERPSNKPLVYGGIKYGDGRGFSTPFRMSETEDCLTRLGD